MPRLAARDLLTIPGLLTLVRAPLAVVFPFVLDAPWLAFTVLGVAGVSDMLDGWWARRTGQETLTGAIVDPVLDKVFVFVVAISLLLGGYLPVHAALLLGVRDLVELPLVLWLSSRPSELSARSRRVKANLFGKAVTVLQFATVAAALLAGQYVEILAVAAGATGLVAGASYWVRMLRRPPPVSPPGIGAHPSGAGEAKA